MKGSQLALVLTGVLLNAIAQLLLKAGSGALAGIELRASNAVAVSYTHLTLPTNREV